MSSRSISSHISLSNEPFFIWLKRYFLIIINRRTSTIKISYFEMNGSQLQMFFSFSNVQITVSVFTIKWNDISFSIHQKLFWIFSAITKQGDQFKYILHCLCIFYPKFFHFPALTLHIAEWKGSCKEFLFVNLIFKSDNIPQATFRGGAWVNNITKIAPRAFCLLSYD